jgi:hypothetical protein
MRTGLAVPDRSAPEVGNGREIAAQWPGGVTPRVRRDRRPLRGGPRQEGIEHGVMNPALAPPCHLRAATRGYGQEPAGT